METLFIVHMPLSFSTISVGTREYMSNQYELDTTSKPGAYNLRIKTVNYDEDNGKFFCQSLRTDNSNSERLVNSIPAVVVVLGKSDLRGKE